MATHIGQKYNFQEIEAKRRLITQIDTILTPELKRECLGLAIIVVTLDEYEIITTSLKRNKSGLKLPNPPIGNKN